MLGKFISTLSLGEAVRRRGFVTCSAVRPSRIPLPRERETRRDRHLWRRSPRVQEATTSIPIVFVIAVDPFRVGLVDNLSHPGGNVTGLDSSVAKDTC